MGKTDKIAVVVIKNHKSEFPRPLVLKKGERLKANLEKTGFAGWIWCTATDRNSGWVPENFTERYGDDCRMLVDYDAAELSVTMGEELTVLSEESDWVWCINDKNKKGWVPLKNVKKL